MSASGDSHEQGTISLADEDAVKEVLRDTILRLWDIVNGLTRLRPSRRERYRLSAAASVAIWGASAARQR